MPSTLTISTRRAGGRCFMRNLASWLKTAVESMDEPRLFHRFVAGIVALALVARLAVFFYFWPTWVWQTGHIQDDWNKLAINWITYGTFGFHRARQPFGEARASHS